MCGIYFSRSCSNGKCKELGTRQKQILKNRGPDAEQQIQLPGHLFAGFVLWQQGSYPSVQPLENDKWILLLNGDIFNAAKENSLSDSEWILERISSCQQENEILKVFKSVEGPFSLLFFNKETKEVYFARDSLGRNSLLISKTEDEIIISSTLSQPETSSTTCLEIPPLGIYKLSESSDTLTLYPWKEFDDYQTEEFQKISTMFTSTKLDSAINPLWILPSQSPYDFNLYSLVDGNPFDNNQEEVFKFLLKDEILSKSIDKFISLLQRSVKDRVLTTPKHCSNCIQEKTLCEHPKVAILFSGGIDCTILASIAHQYVSPNETIELLNVAFEKVGENKDSINYDVPDRISARHSFKELQELFPERQWNLVEINVPRDDLQNSIEHHVKHLIYPLKTVLDESLGCVFWYASKGNTLEYKSPARVILLGSGADELFGGYVRHRNAFTRCKGSFEEKLDSVEKELEIDWQRIPSRNLGRDDRVIADNGKTARSPFIEENIVAFVRSLRGDQKCCMVLPEGVGDKLFLRLTGFRLGLREVAGYKKRAAQFGSRIANKKQNAKDFSVYLKI